MSPSKAIEARIAQKIEKLAQFYDRIIAAHVTVDLPHHKHHQGNLFEVAIELSLPDGKVVVNRHANRDHRHEDIYVAVRDAFNAAKQQLVEYTGRRAV
jgi:ribosomal subunit interface protein